MRPVVITACTHRKRAAASSELAARTLPQGELEAICAEWLRRLRSSSASRLRLVDLYCGRAFREAEAAARRLDASFLVVSAGLGLADENASAPGYDLTLSQDSRDCILRRIDARASDWWRALNGASPFAVSAFDKGGLVLAALSRPYLEMVAEEWAAWPRDRLSRLRIFCKDPPADLPVALRAQWMPYDKRFNSMVGYAGTDGDFAQRALGHFAEHFAGSAGSASDHAVAVRTALAPYTAPPRPKRERRSDEELLALIEQEWDAVEGRSGAMLRRLRRELDVACEQGRFKTLFHRAAAQRRGALL